MVEIPMVEVPLYKNSNIPSSMQGDDAPEFQTEEDEIEYGILHRDFMAFNKQPDPVMDMTGQNNNATILEVVEEEEDGTILRKQEK